MDNQTISIKKHKIVCDDRKNLCITGISKVENTSENQVVCFINDNNLTILGKNMHVKKLDVTEGILEIEGEINEIKYCQERKPFFKRMFK